MAAGRRGGRKETRRGGRGSRDEGRKIYQTGVYGQGNGLFALFAFCGEAVCENWKATAEDNVRWDYRKYFGGKEAEADHSEQNIIVR